MENTGLPPAPPLPILGPPPPAPKRKISKNLARLLGVVVAYAILHAAFVPSPATPPLVVATPSIVGVPGLDSSIDTTAHDPELVALVDKAFADDPSFTMEQMCETISDVGLQLSFRVFDKGAGPGLFEGGYTNREVFDEMASRC
jgi:hypothetical protein